MASSIRLDDVSKDEAFTVNPALGVQEERRLTSSISPEWDLSNVGTSSRPVATRKAWYKKPVVWGLAVLGLVVVALSVDIAVRLSEEDPNASRSSNPNTAAADALSKQVSALAAVNVSAFVPGFPEGVTLESPVAGTVATESDDSSAASSVSIGGKVSVYGHETTATVNVKYTGASQAATASLVLPPGAGIPDAIAAHMSQDLLASTTEPYSFNYDPETYGDDGLVFVGHVDPAAHKPLSTLVGGLSSPPTSTKVHHYLSSSTTELEMTDVHLEQHGLVIPTATLVPTDDASYSMAAHVATVSMDGSSSASATVSGSLSNSSFTLRASQSSSSSSSSTPWLMRSVPVSNAVVTVSGAPDLDDGMGSADSRPIVSGATLTAAVPLGSGFNGHLSTLFPLPGHPNVHVNLGDVKLGSIATLLNLTLDITDVSAALSTRVAIDTGLNPDPLVVGLAGSLNAAGWNASGSLTSWPIDVGYAGAAVDDLSVALYTTTGANSTLALSLGGQFVAGAFSAAAHADIDTASSSIDGFKLNLGVADGTPVSSLINALNNPSTPVPFPDHTKSAVHGAEVATAVITSRPATVTVRAAASNLFNNTNAQLTVMAGNTSAGSWEYGFGAALASGFTPSDLSPDASSFGGFGFVAGTVVGSTSSLFPMSMPLYSRIGAVVDHVTASNGVALKAFIPFGRLFAPAAHVGDATMSVSFNSDPATSLAASIMLPNNLPLGAHNRVVLTSGGLTFDRTPSNGCHASLTGSVLVVDDRAANLTSTVSGSIGACAPGNTSAVAWSVTGTVSDWKVLELLEVEEASVTVSHSDSGVVSGDVAGTFKIGDVTVSGDVGVSDAGFDLTIPKLRVSDNVALENVTLAAGSGSGVSIAATAVIQFGASGPPALAVAVTGSVNGPDFHVTGSVPSWKPVPALTLTSLSLSLSGTSAGAGTPIHLSGTLSASANVLGSTVAVTLALPATDLTLSVANLHISDDITLTTGTVTVDAAGFDLAATASITVPVDSTPVIVDVIASVTNTSKYTLQGSLTSWTISSGFTVADAQVTVNHDVDAAEPTVADIKGDMDIAGVTVLAEVRVPALYLDIGIPHIRLSDSVLLSNVDLTDMGGSSYSLSATANVAPFHGANMTFTVTGTVGSGRLSMAGSAAAVSMSGIGGSSFHMTTVTVNGTWVTSPSHHSVSAFVSGSVDWAGATGDLVLDVSTASKDVAFTVSLTSIGGGFPAVATAATGSSSAASSLPAPSSTLSDLSSPSIESAVLRVTADEATGQAVLSLTGTFSSGASAPYTNADVLFTGQHAGTGSAWDFGFGVAVQSSVKLADTVPGAPSFNDLVFDEGAVVLASSANITVHLPVPSSAGASTNLPTSIVTSGRGLTFLGYLPMTKLSARLEASGKWTSVEGVTFQGHVSTDVAAASLSAVLPPNLPLGPSITVNGTVVVQGADPYLSITATSDVVLSRHQALPPVRVTGEVVIDGEGTWRVSGTASEWQFHVGHTGVTVENVNMTVAEREGDLDGRLMGDVKIGTAWFMLDIELPVPEETEEAGGFEFSLTYAEKLNVQVHPDGTTEALQPTITAIADQLCGPTSGVSGISVPSDWTSVFSASVDDATITVTTAPLALSVSGTVRLFHLNDPLTILMEVGTDDAQGNWAFAFGINLDVNFHISTVLPSIGKIADRFGFASGSVIVSSFEDKKDFTLNGETITVEDSVALVGILELNQGPLSVLPKWTGIDSLVVMASMELESKAFKMSATLDTDWAIGSAVKITNASLFMDVGPPRDFDIGVSVDLAIQVGHRPEDTLGFQAAFMFSDDSIVLQAETLNPWVSPFGLRGVTLGDTEIEIGINIESGLPDLIGLSSTVIVGDVTGSGTVFVDALHPEDTVVAGSLTKWNLGGMLEHLTDNAVPHALADTVLDCGFTGLKFEVNTGEEVLHFNQQSFLPGFYFHVTSFVMWDFIKGGATVAVSEKHGMFVNATIDPILVGSGGDLLTLSGYDDKTAPAQLLIDLGYQSTVSAATSAAAGVATGVASLHQNEVFLSLSAHLLEFLELDAYVLINDEGWIVNATYEEAHLWKTVFQCSFRKAPGATSNIPTDFSLYAEVDLEALTYLGTHVVSFLQQARSSIDSGIDSAEAKVRDWEEHEEPKLEANEAKIREYQAADSAAMSSAEAKLRSAEGKLSSAESKVNGLNNEIHKYDDEKRHCHGIAIGCRSHDAWLDTKIAALWTAEHVADGALDVAKAGVNVAKGAVEAAGKVTPDADPRVLALETADGSIRAAGSVAEAGLKAAKDISDGAAELVEWTVEELMNGFNLQQVTISAASLAGVKHSSKVTLSASGILLHKSFHYTFSTSFPPKLEDMLDNVWTHIKDDLGLK